MRRAARDPLGQLGAPALEEHEARRGVEEAAERELEREGALVVADVVSREQRLELLLTDRGDAVGLSGASPGWRGTSRRRAAAASPLSEPVAGIAGAAGAPAGARPLTTSIAPRALEAPQRGIEGAERDPPEGAERLAQPLLQLVAVAGLLLEQPEDRQLQHVVRSRSLIPIARDARLCASIYRSDISRCSIAQPGSESNARLEPLERGAALNTLLACPGVPTTRSPDGLCCATCAAGSGAATTYAMRILS